MAETTRMVVIDGEPLKLVQKDDFCSLVDNTGAMYARLSFYAGSPAPAGSFWLKDWSENARLVDQLDDQGAIVSTGRTVAVSQYVPFAMSFRVKD